MNYESRGKVRAKWPCLLGLAALSILAIGLNAEAKAAEIDDGDEFRNNNGTRFAPGYSDKVFYSIKLGDDEATVTNLLGAPLSTWTNDTRILGLTHMGQAMDGNPPQKFPNGPRTHWAYASGPMPAFSSKGRLEDVVDYTVFAFDGSGRVEEVFGQVVSAKQVGDLSAGAKVSAGDGLNFLKLSNAQIAMLKGKGFAEIEASFGKPTAVRKSQPLKMLSYSDASSPGKSYRKRIIGINSEAKVAEIDDGDELMLVVPNTKAAKKVAPAKRDHPLPIHGQADPQAKGFLIVFKSNVDVKAELERLEKLHGFKHKFVLKAIKAFAAEMSDAAIEQLRWEPSIERIEHDSEATIQGGGGVESK